MMLRKIILVISTIVFVSTASLQAHIPDSLVNPQHLTPKALLRPFLFKSGPKSVDPMIVSIINQVNPDSIGASIQHLQDYGTRLCTSPQAFQAQNWIQARLQAYGYNTYIQNLTQPAGSSGNIIAELPGTLYPNEYVILGGHYDSYTGQASAPGADDNASGSAGILEIARVLAQQSFDRSIILCLWSAEELGCYGSIAYAQEASANNKNILGYLNLDMCGYLYGNVIHTNVIGSNTALPLMNFYQEVCSQYLPAFQVTLGGNLPGSSDHASFNNAGYMGIFPFEDVDHYSPLIHTPNDLLGTSVNSLPMAVVFTQSVLATALEMSQQVPSPIYLTAQPSTQQITLNYINPGVPATEYHIFRDDMNTVYDTTTDTFYVDQNVVSGTMYQYAVTLVSASSGKESVKSNKVLAKAVGPMVLPFTDDMENGFTWWMTTEDWAFTTSSAYSPTTSLTDSPLGNYGNSINSSVYLQPFDLSLCNVVTLNFWCKYNLENNYDFVYAEVSDGGEYQALGTYTGIQTAWGQNSINLSSFAGKPYVSVRFRITSDSYWNADGFYVDDINIDAPGVGVPSQSASGWNIQASPNPFSTTTKISFTNPTAGKVRLDIYNSMGQHITTLCDEQLSAGNHQYYFNAKGLNSGMYYYRLVSGEVSLCGKLVKSE